MGHSPPGSCSKMGLIPSLLGREEQGLPDLWARNRELHTLGSSAGKESHLYKNHYNTIK